jgi:uncharacterized membrane protein YfcA
MTDYVELIKLVTLGIAAGILSGLFGIGGGLVIVPVLVVFFGFPVKVAVGTSLFVILLPTGVLGVLEYWKAGNIRIVAALWIGLGVLGGAYFGASVAASVNPITMKRLYAVFLLVVGVYFLVAPAKTPRSRAETEAKLVPPEAVGGAADPQAVH